ncbi:hypothetical protein [Phytohabitans rumicis]|uniref:Uncharacterized protein n=1 Tax=Phytohabitans rumicis TaxID=1076125 RepID=A0A6V8L8S1_9ACTN|nr:hypothetical protein [Phytohabitans rumicis]GFJ93643.1 hypothetical protein Prum_072850 [Phytohabitans rumicis]
MWESMLSTMVGGAVAAGAGVLTTLVQARQASRMRYEQQQREDRYRLYQDRVEAYVTFHTLASKARRVLQDFTDDTADDDLERREARNEAHLTYVKIALIGGIEVVAAARRVMIKIDAVTYRREAFDSDLFRHVISKFQEAARRDLTGQDDLASILVETHWPDAPPRSRAKPSTTGSG